MGEPVQPQPPVAAATPQAPPEKKKKASKVRVPRKPVPNPVKLMGMVLVILVLLGSVTAIVLLEFVWIPVTTFILAAFLGVCIAASYEDAPKGPTAVVPRTIKTPVPAAPQPAPAG